jgi:hypothetical protein
LVCSNTQKSLLTLFPSIWCPAVAAPQWKPFGKARWSGSFAAAAHAGSDIMATLDAMKFRRISI